MTCLNNNELDKVIVNETRELKAQVSTMMDGGEVVTFTLTSKGNKNPLNVLTLPKENYYDEEIVTLFTSILQLADSVKRDTPWLKHNLRAICMAELGNTADMEVKENPSEPVVFMGIGFKAEDAIEELHKHVVESAEASGIIMGTEGRLKETIVEDES